MPYTCRAATALVSLLAILASVAPPAAAGAAAGAPSSSETTGALTGEPRVRTTDARLRRLLDEAVLASPSLRALVDRLQQSDVVVYVQCERYPSSRVAGRLTFVSAAGGRRYVVVRLQRLESRAQQIALLAHELQHAVEIADTPAIVDGLSLAREYQRMGYINTWSTTPGIAFDTTAAVDVGRKVLQEITAANGD